MLDSKKKNPSVKDRENLLARVDQDDATGHDAVTEFLMKKLKAFGSYVASCTIMWVPILFFVSHGLSQQARECS